MGRKVEWLNTVLLLDSKSWMHPYSSRRLEGSVHVGAVNPSGVRFPVRRAEFFGCWDEGRRLVEEKHARSRSPAFGRSATKERQQLRVDLIWMRGSDAVRGAGIVDLFCALDDPCGLNRGVLDGDDLIVLAVQDEGGNVEFF